MGGAPPAGQRETRTDNAWGREVSTTGRPRAGPAGPRTGTPQAPGGSRLPPPPPPRPPAGWGAGGAEPLGRRVRPPGSPLVPYDSLSFHPVRPERLSDPTECSPVPRVCPSASMASDAHHKSMPPPVLLASGCRSEVPRTPPRPRRWLQQLTELRGTPACTRLLVEDEVKDAENSLMERHTARHRGPGAGPPSPWAWGPHPSGVGVAGRSHWE